MSIKRFIFKVLLGLILASIMCPILVILRHMGLTFNLSLFIASAVIVLSHDPIEKWLANITDKYLFQKDYDYWGVMNQISDDFDTMKDRTYPSDLKKYIISAVIDKLRLENAVILEEDEFEKEQEIKKRLKMVCSHPIYLNQKPHWLLLTGRKISGTRYSKSDHTMLSTLSTKFSIFLSLITIKQTVAIGKQINAILSDSD